MRRAAVWRQLLALTAAKCRMNKGRAEYFVWTFIVLPVLLVCSSRSVFLSCLNAPFLACLAHLIVFFLLTIFLVVFALDSSVSLLVCVPGVCPFFLLFLLF